MSKFTASAGLDWHTFLLGISFTPLTLYLGPLYIRINRKIDWTAVHDAIAAKAAKTYADDLAKAYGNHTDIIEHETNHIQHKP